MLMTSDAGDSFLREVGERVRRRREELGWTQRRLAERAGLSLRFLAQLEHGDGNISLARFSQVAAALNLSPAELLGPPGPGRRAGDPEGAEAASADGGPEGQRAPTRPRPRVALLGLRGAGKSTVGRLVAARLRVPFIELDDEIVRLAGLSLAEIFELHGEAYFRRREREALRNILAAYPAFVLATGGSLVNDPRAYRLLREHALTFWLKARPEDHWNRVVEQGDRRPMAENPHAYAELRALRAAREPLYATAHHVVDTHRVAIDRVASKIASALL